MNTVITDANAIELHRLRTLRAALKLEIYGMKHSSGKSAYGILKNEYSLKGSKQEVFEAVSKILFEKAQLPLDGI